MYPLLCQRAACIPDFRAREYRALRDALEAVAAPKLPARDAYSAQRVAAATVGTPAWDYLSGFVDAAARFRFAYREYPDGSVVLDYIMLV